MPVKKNTKNQKDFSREDNCSKMDDQNHPDDRIRILQNNLVFVNGLPHEISSKEILQKNIYFGRYGSINKIILNPSHPFKKGATYQAYVTYQNQFESSLAIAALDGYNYQGKSLKVSYGTTKYCSHFLRGTDCPNSDCFYLHDKQKEKEVSNGDSRNIFKQQNIKAIEYVCIHLQQLIRSIEDSDYEEVEDGFPSLSEVLDYLVQEGQITEKEIDEEYAIYNNKPQQTQKAEPQNTRPSQNNHEEPVLKKCNSNSTMCTPSKQPNDARSQNSPPPPTRQFEDSSCCKQNRTIAQNNMKKQQRKQNPAKQIKIEEHIQKLIIKQIFKNSNNQCRSKLVKELTASREECSKIKGIVQKVLISSN